ncbi:hypothetical protein [Aeromicrobium sp. UC242_57]|uniref:hypothetical protein n=1 Tax=Aeromicrobium sp. UC242_57 TaxID=3374624 RepID=UPI0037A13C40
MNVRIVAGDQLTAQDVYDIWKIRDAVFAFEQHVEDVDVDGLDLLATTTHLWLADVHGPTSLPAGVRGGRRAPRRTGLHPQGPSRPGTLRTPDGRGEQALG